MYCGLAVFVVGLAGGVKDVALNTAVADVEAIHEIIVYQNDFGTIEQRTVGGTGDWERDNSGGRTQAPRWESNNPDADGALTYPEATSDRDGDGLHGMIFQYGAGNLAWEKQITAPAGATFSNIRIVAEGGGWGTTGGQAIVQLRRVPVANDRNDPHDYQIRSQVSRWREEPKGFDNRLTDNTDRAKSSGGTGIPDIDTTGDPNYTSITECYITVFAESLGEHRHYQLGRMTAITVYADVNGLIATVNETGGSTVVDEAGETSDSFSIALVRAPAADVTITLTPTSNANEFRIGLLPIGAPHNLVFTKDNWNEAQTVTINAHDDVLDEDPERGMIELSSASSDPNFNDKPVFLPLVVKIRDDDEVGINITETDGSTNVAEQGETSDTYAVALNLVPTQDVTVNILDKAARDEVRISPGQLTFTKDNWNVSQTVTVTAMDDTVGESYDPNHKTIISHTATSVDLGYDGLVENLNVTIVDNSDVFWTPIVARHLPETDLPGNGSGIVKLPDVSVAQEGTVYLEFKLDSIPYSSGYLWQAFGDEFEVSCSINESGDELHFNAYNAELIPGVAPARVFGALTPFTDTTSWHSLYLAWKANEWIIMALDGADVHPDGHLNPPSIPFGGSKDPSTATGAHVIGTNASVAAFHIDGQIRNVLVSDAYIYPKVTIVHTSDNAEVDEQGETSDSFTIRLHEPTAPTGDVTLTLTPDTDDVRIESQGPGDPYELVFTTGNWNVPQTVTISAYDDAIIEKDDSVLIRIRSTSGDKNFHNQAFLPVIVQVSDNDAAELAIVESGGSTDVAEQGQTSDTYTVVLGLAPTQNVSVDIVDESARDEVAIAPEQLTFTAANWNVPQTVRVTAMDDSFGEDSRNHQTIVSHTASSMDPSYHGLMKNVNVTVIDNGDTRQAPVLDARHWGMFGGRQPLDFTFYDMTGYDTFATEAGAQGWWDSIHAQRVAGRYQLPVLRPATKAHLDMMFSPVGNVTTHIEDLVGIALGHEVTTGADSTENELYDYIKSKWPQLQVYKFYSHPIMPLSFASGAAEKCDGYLYDDYYTTNAVEFRRRVMKCLVTGKPLVMTLWASTPEDPDIPAFGGFFSDDWVKGLPPSGQNGLVTNSPNSSFERYFRNNSNTLREFGLSVGLYGIAPLPCCNSNPPWWTGNRISPNLGYIVNELALPLRDDMKKGDGRKLPSAEFSEGYELSDASMTDGKLDMRIDTGGAYSYVDDFKTDGAFIGLGTIDDASIRNFSKLLQMPARSGVLTTRDNDDGPGYVELIYRFYTDSGKIGSVHAKLLSSVATGQGGINLLGLSKNGKDITRGVKSTPGVDTEETLAIHGDAGYENVAEFYVHVRMSYESSPASSPANRIHQLDVTAVHD